MRSEDQVVAALLEFFAQPVFDNSTNQAALGVPEDQAGAGFFLNAEEIEFGAEFAVIAALGFFEAMEIFVEFLLGVEGSGINALELRIPFLSFPVRAGDAHEFERLDAFGGRNVRAAAEIDEFAGGVKRDHRLVGFFLDRAHT